MEISVSKLTNIVLASVLLTALFFVAVTSSSGEYDPWIDYNEDGWINAKDAIALGNAFSSSGSPAKNVTIVGRANKLAYALFNQSVDAYGYFMTPWILVDGYSKITVSIFTDANANGYGLYAVDRNFNTSASWGFLVDYQSDLVYGCLVKTYDVPNEMIQILFGNNDASARHFHLDVYLVP